MVENETFKLPGQDGLKCSNCGEVLPRVTRTVKTPGFITRERICLACNSLNITAERVIASRPRNNFNAPFE